MDGGFVVSVEEFRQGINMNAGAGQGGAAVPSGLPRGAPAGTAADSPFRGEAYVPKSWLRAQNGNGLSEDEKVAKLRKIRESAQEYEGLLMAEMIKMMRQKPMAKTPGSDTLSEIAEKPFTAALAAAGGLGLADKIVEDVASQEGLAGTLSDHPEIMGPNWRQRIAPSRLYKPVSLGGAPGRPGPSGSGAVQREDSAASGEAAAPAQPALQSAPNAASAASAAVPAASAARRTAPAGGAPVGPGDYANFRRGPGAPRQASRTGPGTAEDAEARAAGGGGSGAAEGFAAGTAGSDATEDVAEGMAEGFDASGAGSIATAGVAAGEALSEEDLPPAGVPSATSSGKAATDAWARKAFRPERPAGASLGAPTPLGSPSSWSPDAPTAASSTVGAPAKAGSLYDGPF
jgi:Rod binding domain-containing protein